ncbi:MAG: SDR family NAD(P)-dependent oxidoreductase [Anaerocolumna sp.]
MEKFIVITGASSGIGYEAAKEFARKGKNLIVIARSTDKREQLKDEVLEINSFLQVIIKATKTNFGNVANNIPDYDYDKAFGIYHTCEQAVGFLRQLYDSNRPVGLVNRETFEFSLCDYQFSYAGKSKHNQKVS